MGIVQSGDAAGNGSSAVTSSAAAQILLPSIVAMSAASFEAARKAQAEAHDLQRQLAATPTAHVVSETEAAPEEGGGTGSPSLEREVEEDAAIARRKGEG